MTPWKYAGLACILSCLGAASAFADDCTGRDHSTGTILGAVGGAAIGGAASHNAGGAVAGAVIGGLAGNAIDRSQDCNRSNENRAVYDNRDNSYDARDDNRGNYGRDEYSNRSSYYRPSYLGADEDDYWGVESYNDFNNDYEHIAWEIQQGRREGELSRSDANRYSRELQRIRQRADWEQRTGRFDADEIEGELRNLRGTIQYARNEDNRYNR